jgi:hypothetical protein
VTPASPVPQPALPARRSALWSGVFRVAYRLIRLTDRLIASVVANGFPGLDRVVELRTVGRRSGHPRRLLVTLLTVDGRDYVGHPNGPAPWTLNALAAGWVEIAEPGGRGERFAVNRLEPGPERDAVIRATWRQQPFPGNVLYRAARRHVAAVGVYFRLDRGERSAAAASR